MLPLPALRDRSPQVSEVAGIEEVGRDHPVCLAAYQTRAVCEPDNRLSMLPDVAAPLGNAGMPSDALATIVPDNPSTWAFSTSTRSWAAVRGGRSEIAWAESTPLAAIATTPTTPVGTIQRSAWLRRKTERTFTRRGCAACTVMGLSVAEAQPSRMAP